MDVKTVIKKGKLLETFPVLYEGWEYDYEAWVYELDGRNYVVGTNHGSLYIMTSLELSDKINEYENAIEKTKEALARIS